MSLPWILKAGKSITLLLSSFSHFTSSLEKLIPFEMFLYIWMRYFASQHFAYARLMIFPSWFTSLLTDFPGDALVKNPPASVEAAGDMSLISGLGKSLEKEMATHSSILAWEIPWTEDPGRLGYSPWDLKQSDTTYQLKQQQSTCHIVLHLQGLCTWEQEHILISTACPLHTQDSLGRQ